MKKTIDQQTSYRHKIKKIKNYIALFAVFILSSLFVIQYFYRMSPAVIEDESESKMLAPRYYGLDEKDHPYKVQALKVTQISEKDKLFALEKPDGLVTLDEGKWSRVVADEGLLDDLKRILTLKGNVVLLQEDGQEYHTSLAYVHLKTGYIYGDDKMEGFGPKGDIKSQGFQIFDYGQKYIFKGRAYISLPTSSLKDKK